MSLAAVAAGADALMIEVHDSPDLAKSDGDQALLPTIFDELFRGSARSPQLSVATYSR